MDTLHNELGFGKLDGLRFDAERETVVVTTARLLDEYLRVRKLPNSLGELSKTGKFYFGVFDGGAAVTHYAELPVKVANSETFAYAFLGLVAQDIGPYVPTTVFAFVKNGSRITIASAPPQQEINQIPACQQEWEGFESKARQARSMVDRLQKVRVE